MQQIKAKKKNDTWLGSKYDQLWIVQQSDFFPTTKWCMHKSESVVKMTKPSESKKRKKWRTYRIGEFTLLVNYRGKMKESEMREKYFDLARELRTVWNMVVAFVAYWHLTEPSISDLPTQDSHV